MSGCREGVRLPVAMTGEGIVVVGVLVGIVVLFVSEKYPLDIVAMLGLGVLLVLGLVTLQEGLSGFSNPATLTVGSMFVLGAGLQKTGATATVGRLMVRFSRNHYEVGALSSTATKSGGQRRT